MHIHQSRSSNGDISVLKAELNARSASAVSAGAAILAAVYIPFHVGRQYIYALSGCVFIILLSAAYAVYRYAHKKHSECIDVRIPAGFFPLLGVFMLPLLTASEGMPLCVSALMSCALLAAPCFGIKGRLLMLALYIALNATSALIKNSPAEYYAYFLAFAASGFAAAGIIHVGNDIIIKRLLRDAQTDALTGLLNRGCGYSRLEDALASCRRLKSAFCVMMVDVDDFKKLNDCLGHAEGDAALARVAGIIRQSFLRGTDVAFRYGGEEFVIGIPVSGADEARKTACELINAVNSLNICCSPPQARLSVSIGVYTLPCSDLCTTAEQAIRIADNAMYTAKARGKGIAVLAP